MQKEEAELEVDVSEVWVASSFINERLAADTAAAGTGLIPMGMWPSAACCSPPAQPASLLTHIAAVTLQTCPRIQ